MTKKRRWRVVAMLMACMMAVTACGQQGKTEESSKSSQSESQKTGSLQASVQETSLFNETGFPIVNEEITLKVLAWKSPESKIDHEDMPGWKYLSELTGINFEIEAYTSEELSTKLPLIMSDEDTMPDLFIQTAQKTLEYGEQGRYLELTDLIEQYGDNIKKAWEDNPINKVATAESNGKIYGLHSFVDTGIPTFVWSYQVNDRWLKNCGITEYPTTVEEFKDMLIAFRDMDANGNGDPDDEIPMNGNLKNMMQVIAINFGLPLDYPWQGAMYGRLYGKTEPEPLFMTENYRAMIEYIADLYEEKLINQDMFSVSTEEDTARRLADVYGAYAHMTNAAASEKYDPSEFTTIPVVGSEYYDPTEYAYDKPHVDFGMGAISAFTEYPEVCFRVLDYMYSMDGTALFAGNLHNGSCDLVAAGVSQEIIDMYETEMKANGGDVNMAHKQIVGCNGPLWTTPFEPYKSSATFASHIHETLNEVRKSFTGRLFVNPTGLSLTEEEQEIINVYKTDINGYVTETVAGWIAGTQELNDETWDAYIKKLKSMNVDKLTEAYVSYYERYSAE